MVAVRCGQPSFTNSPMAALRQAGLRGIRERSRLNCAGGCFRVLGPAIPKVETFKMIGRAEDEACRQGSPFCLAVSKLPASIPHPCSPQKNPTCLVERRRAKMVLHLVQNRLGDVRRALRNQERSEAKLSTLKEFTRALGSPGWVSDCRAT